MARSIQPADSDGIPAGLVPRFPAKSINQLEEDNKKLFDEIIELCKDTERKPAVILLVGKTGAGKSAFINTLYQAITGRYHKKAKTGRGLASSVTLGLIWYEKCGVDLKLVADAERRDKLQQCIENFAVVETLSHSYTYFPANQGREQRTSGEQRKSRSCFDNLPNLIDFAGLGDDDSEEIQIIFDRLLRGCIEPGTNLKDVLDVQQRYAPDILNSIQCMDRVVSHVIFVQSYREPLPKKLIKCLQNVISATDGKGAGKYATDVTVLLTHYDEICFPGPKATEQEISRMVEEYEAAKAAIAELFSIKGSTGDYLKEWMNYSDNLRADQDYNDDRKKIIENKALTLLKDILEPGVPFQKPQRPLEDWRMKVRVGLREIFRKVESQTGWNLTPVRNVESRMRVEFLLGAVGFIFLAVFMALLSLKP